MTTPEPLVFVIDDDPSVRRGLVRLLTSADYRSEVFDSATAFLERPAHDGYSCVIVDVKMPGLSGIELQEALIRQQREEHLIFITGHGDITMCAQVMKSGAVDFLSKPFKAEELLGCVRRALERSAAQLRQKLDRKSACSLIGALTPREHEVMQSVIAGLLNKQIAARLGMAEKTVKVHRGRVMQKLGISSVAELVRLAHHAGVASLESDKAKV